MSEKSRRRGGKPNTQKPGASPALPWQAAPFLNGYLPLSDKKGKAKPPAEPRPSASDPGSDGRSGAGEATDAATGSSVPAPARMAGETVSPMPPADRPTAPEEVVASVASEKAAPGAAAVSGWGGIAALPREVEKELIGGAKPPEGWRESLEAPFAEPSAWFPAAPAAADGSAPRPLPDTPEPAAPEVDKATETLVEEVEAQCPEGRRLYIVMITPEVAPAAKVGGLGDMVVGLGRALEKRGHRVEVVVPMYDGLRRDCIEDLRLCYNELWVPHGAAWNKEQVFSGRVSGLKTFFVTGGLYTLRPNIYGYPDDLRRFAYFTRAAMEFLFKTERRPDILHAHDWGTALAPVMLYDLYGKLGWNRTRTVFTIHNHETQGLTQDAGGLLGLVGLDWRNYMRQDRLQDSYRPNNINLMKGAVVYSNFVTTVSPTYAGEIKTPLGGRGLNPVLCAHSVKVGGVINGIDYDIWNPRTDPMLAARYSAGGDFTEKYKNKYELRGRLNLQDCWKPIISVITRLTEQKGLNLIRAAIGMLSKMEAQVVLLGSAPDPKVDGEFHRLAHELRDNRDINLWLGYNEDLAHLIYAGSDLFLIPSLYEPCGLTQMIAMRYGTVPVARRTGGLADTVVDLDTSGRGLAEANGFLFDAPTPEAMGKVLQRAVRMWYEDPKSFERLAKNGMARDFSWRYPARDYENIYNYIKA